MATSGARSEPPLVVIVGPTASGKSALAIELAKQFNGEIICADSRTVYKGMDIGTAKPSREERAQVPHWGLDLVEPDQRFTAADFQRYAQQAMTDIRSRGHVPFVVGGTGLYVDGLLFDYEFGEDHDPERRHQLEMLAVEELQEYCYKHNIQLPRNDQNHRQLVRAIEQESINEKRKSVPIQNTIVVGIATNREILRARIAVRIEQMLTHGVVEEAIKLGKKYGWEAPAMTSNIYPLIKLHLEDQLTQAEIVDKNTTVDWQLAKRQMTWFRRNPYINWGRPEQIHDYVTAVLEQKV